MYLRTFIPGDLRWIDVYNGSVTTKGLPHSPCLCQVIYIYKEGVCFARLTRSTSQLDRTSLASV